VAPELQQVVGDCFYSILLEPDRNNLDGLVAAVRALNAGVSVEIKKNKKQYRLSFVVARTVATNVELREAAGDPKSNLLDSPPPVSFSAFLVSRSKLIDQIRKSKNEVPLDPPGDADDDAPAFQRMTCGGDLRQPLPEEPTTPEEWQLVVDAAAGFRCIAELGYHPTLPPHQTRCLRVKPTFGRARRRTRHSRAVQ
jgi:hypothetical protein